MLRKDSRGYLLPNWDIWDYPSEKIRPITISIGWDQIFEGPSRWNLTQWYQFIDRLVEYRYNTLYLLSWKSDLVFPFDWYQIRHYRWIREYNVMPELKLEKWNGKKIVREKWRHPFLEDPEMPKKIASYAHSYGIRLGYFTTPRFVCQYKEDSWLDYWRHVFSFLTTEYKMDAFIIEEEETPEPYDHFLTCSICKKRWGSLPMGRIRYEAHKHHLLMDIIKNFNGDALVSTVSHYSLYRYGMLWDPAPDKVNWCKNIAEYRQALEMFKKLAPQELFFSWTPGEKKLNEIWEGVFKGRIIKSGYNGYWPTLSEEREIDQPVVAESLWSGKERTVCLKKAADFLYGKGKKYLTHLKELDIDGACLDLNLFKGWDKPEAMPIIEKHFKQSKDLFSRNLTEIQECFIKACSIEGKIEYGVFPDINSCFLSGSPSKEGVKKILGLIKKSRLALEYLMTYASYLQTKRKIYLKKLFRTGSAICDAMVDYIPHWPGTGNRMEFVYKGRYAILSGRPIKYDLYLRKAQDLLKYIINFKK